MRIATWNINGVKARLEGAVTWLKETSPDVACFQEIKSVNEAFPSQVFEDLGYNVAVHGQKGFNGVAILSKRPFDEIAVRGLPGDEADQHARYIEVCVPRKGGVVRIGNGIKIREKVIVNVPDEISTASTSNVPMVQ